MVPPTDGRENDPLQRWKGAPVAFWGVGGTMVTAFPKDIPSIKDTDPLEERLAKFPGPLKGKSKKKETISWLSTGIEELEKNLPSPSFQTQISHEHKRAEERVLLWKILRLFVEYDGVLEGNAAVDKAVRDVLSPGSDGSKDVLSPIYATGAESTGLHESSTTQMQADSVDSTTIEQIKNSLVSGDREQAVWAAADKRLWGHALLIANTVSPDLYHKVSQEFIKKEVNIAGHNNESLAALYAVLSGNHEESVDELVPVHARAGLQMVSKSLSTGPAKAGLEGLDKWRETLTLILSNRSSDDTRALNSLGNLLSGYGRAEAAHICFIFARNNAVFGGLDDPQSSFVLVGADHKRQAEQFAKETEPLLLSEVYEYGLSLAGTSNIGVSCPHLAAYKFQHAMTLAEYGFRDKALQYCEVIFNAINSQTRRSPYHHAVLEGAVEDLMKRLKQAPKEESGSWIPKPSYSPYAPQAPSGGASPYAPAEPAPETKEGGIGTDSTPSYGYQPPSYGYEPPSLTTPEESQSQAPEHTSSGGYEPPSYQPYGYEPPSYEANPEPTNDDGDSGSEKAKPKKSFMDDEDDDIPALRSQTPGEKSKAEKDKENEELFRKAAEEDAKRAAAEKEAKAKKGWGFGGWFGGAKKETLENSPNKPVRANLGEQSSFYYDPDQKRWINKKAGAEDNAPKKATPPPPRGIPRSATGTPPLPAATSMPELGRASAPPPRTTLTPSPLSNPNGPPSNLAAPPLMARSVSNTSAPGAPPSGPPSRPTTSMSNASSIDDLLGAAGTTKRGPKKPKKGGRYVDVMAK
ncbi:putative copii coat assembly protein sec16 protein [Phaeoacremonium minimum UCRPA7]|uniref:Protein transport protein sec16 n=1 Tax=Phaeoacremonium minimum (strain UCR-PA7) TaxID=1286976 RepID=R8BBD8_PHAM7|nr:putative copii coat assembly protein sec16 protein [Phaeoacremonium minimum UCRPA7]EON96643.1 putative copii coat assembly protein sec16 protein [Phaeoacremonium minimum UCRPA7]